jgi:hypothetical protein
MCSAGEIDRRSTRITLWGFLFYAGEIVLELQFLSTTGIHEDLDEEGDLEEEEEMGCFL